MSAPSVYSHGLFAIVLAVIFGSYALRLVGGMTQVIGYYVTVCAAVFLAVYGAHADPPLEPLRLRRLLALVAVLAAMSMVSSYPPGF